MDLQKKEIRPGYIVFPNVLWKNPGGDFVQEPSAITDVDAEGMYEWSGDDIIEDIKIWITNPEFNAVGYL